MTIALALAFAHGATPAFASGTNNSPTVLEFRVPAVHATRALVEGQVYPNASDKVVENCERDVTPPDTIFRIEYATSATSPSWQVASSGTTAGIVSLCAAQTHAVLQHLVPETTYYVRATVENQNGKAVSATIPFTTTAASGPEVELEERGLEGPQCPPSWEKNSFLCERHLTIGSVELESEIQTNGLETEYRFEYALSSGGPWTLVPGGSGSVTPAEDFAMREASLAGLKPETEYYVRVVASNAKGSATKQTLFKTHSIRAQVLDRASVSSVTAMSAHLSGSVFPGTYETEWRFESAPSEGGPWSVVPNGSGTISAASASEERTTVDATLTGLDPSHVYYVRLSAENEPEGKHFASTSPIGGFRTAGAPVVSTFAVHTFSGEAIQVIGSVGLDTEPIDTIQEVRLEGAPSGGTFTLSFAGQTTTALSVDAREVDVRHALEALSSIGKGNVTVSGNAGGPYRVEFIGAHAGVAEPLLTADGSQLTPTGSVSVAMAQEPFTYDTRYHVEYVTEEQFAKSAWAEAQSSPAVDAGAGEDPTTDEEPGKAPLLTFASRIVSDVLPGLEAGRAYRYRFVASNTTPGDPVVRGNERTLVAPAGSGSEEQQSGCPNEQLRLGPSARLPDCRGYEQVSPAEKEGANEPFAYGPAFQGGTVVAPGGESLALYAPYTNWGSGTHSGQGPYFFSHTSGGWQMTAAGVQPAAGAAEIVPHIFSPDLGQFAFTAQVITSTEGHAPNVEFKAGQPGGPYTVVASVPEKQVGNGGWVASSEDFSKLILQVEDHNLVGSSTGTLHGDDLYEWSSGQLRQVNVGVGSCGARIARGAELQGAPSSSVHAVSSDGSRVFFEAAPGNNCGESPHLYMRVDGARTVDLGAYAFRAANAAGTQLILENGAHEFFVDQTNAEGATAKLLFAAQSEPAALTVSGDLSAIYFESRERLTGEAPAPSETEAENLYKYSGGTLGFVAQAVGAGMHVGLDGRDLYLEAETVAGVPGGVNEHLDGTGLKQTYRYDATENVVQCMSCASPTDPEPRERASFGLGAPSLNTENGLPDSAVASANGDFVVFTSVAELVPQDRDGEVPVQAGKGEEHVDSGAGASVSSDVYEWRRDGVDGCGRAQGCLALITSGGGGLMNLRVGIDESGKNIFFYTYESLVGQDRDTAGDIYDARIGGGEAPAARPIACEGDSCSAAPSAPIDPTPSSATFSGAGNVLQPAVVAPQTAAKAVTKCARGKRLRHGRCVKKKKKKKKKRSAGRSSNHRRGK
jgi:hypothetical protein